MEETREIILSLYVKHSWLNSIHYHVGSQGITIDMFVKAANICVGFVKEIEIATGRSLQMINIGGGLATSYTSPEEPEHSSYSLYRSGFHSRFYLLITNRTCYTSGTSNFVLC